MIRKEELLIGTKQELLDYFTNELKIQNKTQEEALCNSITDFCETSFGETLENQLDIIYSKGQHFGMIVWMKVWKDEEIVRDVKEVIEKISLEEKKVWIQEDLLDEDKKLEQLWTKELKKQQEVGVSFVKEEE